MLKRMLKTGMLVGLLTSTAAGYAGVQRVAHAPAVAPRMTAAQASGLAAASCEERPAPRRHRIEPEGCLDEAVFASR